MGTTSKSKGSHRSQVVRSTSDPDLLANFRLPVNPPRDSDLLQIRSKHNNDRNNSNAVHRLHPPSSHSHAVASSSSSSRASNAIFRQNSMVGSASQYNGLSKNSSGGLRSTSSSATGGKCPHCNVRLKWPNGLRKHVEVCYFLLSPALSKAR